MRSSRIRRYFALLVTAGSAYVAAVAHASGDVDFHVASVVSRCASPRISMDAHLPHGCVNRMPKMGEALVDACSGKLFLNAAEIIDQDSIDDWVRRFRAFPEWATQRIGSGPGMRGVLPWGCTYVAGALADTVPNQPSLDIASTVASLRAAIGEASGKTLGSAILISPRLLLTARHVVCDQNDQPANLTHAIFRDFNSDIYAPASHEELVVARIARANGYPRIIIASEALDYALIALDQDDGAVLPKPLEIPVRAAVWSGSLPHGKPLVLGYSDNVFFPRGLVVSAHGSWQPAPSMRDDVHRARYDIFYDVNTAKGFSGGAVFDSDFRWRGMHLHGFSADGTIDNSDPLVSNVAKLGAQRLHEFSRPNGGISIEKIFNNMASHFDKSALAAIFGSDKVAHAVSTYRVSSDAALEPISAFCAPVKKQVSAKEVSANCADVESGDNVGPPRESKCYVNYYHEAVKKLVPAQWQKRWPAVGALVATNLHNKDELIGSAVLVAPDLVVSAGHVIPIPDAIALHSIKFVLGYQPENLAGAPPVNCVVTRSVARPILASSARSLRDFLILQFDSPIDLSQLAGNCLWKVLDPVASPKEFVATTAYAVGHQFEQVDRDLTLFYAGKFSGFNRWSKDGGGTLNIDYTLPTKPGASGGAVLDEKFGWVALHQRSLSRARNDADSDWHPYGHWVYGDTRLSCGKGRLPVQLDKINISDCWPAQGTLVSDIALDTAEALGTAWLCSKLPKWAALLPARDEFSCDGGVRDRAERRERYSGQTE